MSNVLSRQNEVLTKTVPGRLDVISNPIVDSLVVVLGVLDVIVDLLRVVLVSRPA